MSEPADHSSLPDDIAEARARAGRALRELGHALVGHHADVGEVDALTAELDRRTAQLRANDVRDRVITRPTGDWGPPPADGEEMLSFDERPVSGRSSPYGLDLSVVRAGHEAIGTLTLGAAHEGAPGRSHGGIISALFDDVFGFVLSIEQLPAFTGTLSIRYEQGVPIHRPLECRVRLDRTEGRKLMMSGELSGPGDDGEPTVFTRATAIFIAIDVAAFRATADPSS